MHQLSNQLSPSQYDLHYYITMPCLINILCRLNHFCLLALHIALLNLPQRILLFIVPFRIIPIRTVLNFMSD